MTPPSSPVARRRSNRATRTQTPLYQSEDRLVPRRSSQLPVVPVPGASALLAARVASGSLRNSFRPRTGGERRGALDEITTLRHTAVLYEPNRVTDTQARSRSGRRWAGGAVARSDQQFEEVRRTVTELARTRR